MVDDLICWSILQIIYSQTVREVVSRVQFCVTEEFQKSEARSHLLNIVQQ